ncbi:FkbM family methyltransferase [Citreimonas sp.]|uniref:FkbM family methyltransferase n=1 Tax=Citreimonas sp. TaxID=3036715 RepID=UPI0040590C2B
MTPRAAALRRSFDIYWRDMARAARMDALNARFVKKGMLAFDIGAHVGDRTASFRCLGARVVAVEPQPRIFRALQLVFRGDAGVTLERSAVADTEGHARLHVNSANPTVSTLNPGFIAAAAGNPLWTGQRWDEGLEVPVTTLDALIARHGTPHFVKIDVEGHEADVLSGLSVPLRALSFEITTLRRDVGHACVDRLSHLGDYVFALSLGEDHALRPPGWVDRDAMHTMLRALPDAANSGDVFAWHRASGVDRDPLRYLP